MIRSWPFQYFGMVRSTVLSGFIATVTMVLPWLVKINPEETGIQTGPSQVIDGFSLSQNYPNPFNPSTRIQYKIPKSAHVTLTVYDALGREIKILVNKFQSADEYSIDYTADDISSGIYFYQLNVGDDYSQTRKMLLLR